MLKLVGLKGCRVAGLQGYRVAGLQGCRVAGLQGYRVAGLQGGPFKTALFFPSIFWNYTSLIFISSFVFSEQICILESQKDGSS